MKKEYTTVVYGATFLGLGIASCDPAHTLVLEPGGTLGPEYIDALRFTPRLSEPLCPLAADLHRELARRKVYGADGVPHLPAVAPVLANLVRDRGIEVFFLSALAGVAEERNRLRVTSLSLNEFLEFECRHFVDTTGDVALLRAANALEAATINFMQLAGAPGGGARAPHAGLSELRGAHPNYRVFALSVEPGRPFHEYRKAVIDLLRAKPESLGGGQLLSIASHLALSASPVRQARGGGGSFMPSVGSSDLFDALNRGQRGGGELR